MNTKEWAESLGISSDLIPPSIENYDEPIARTKSEIVIRSLILQGIVAIAYGVESEPIIEWFQEKNMWEQVTKKEREFLTNSSPTQETINKFRCQVEAEWTLLWAVQKVETLGLPTKYCNSAKLVDEIIPPLGDDIQPFTDSSILRTPGELLAEDNRTYNMWCYAQPARRNGTLPEDLNLTVLYQRRYAFEWLDGFQEWDDVTCDA